MRQAPKIVLNSLRNKKKRVLKICQLEVVYGRQPRNFFYLEYLSSKKFYIILSRWNSINSKRFGRKSLWKFKFNNEKQYTNYDKFTNDPLISAGYITYLEKGLKYVYNNFSRGQMKENNWIKIENSYSETSRIIMYYHLIIKMNRAICELYVKYWKAQYRNSCWKFGFN